MATTDPTDLDATAPPPDTRRLWALVRPYTPRLAFATLVLLVGSGAGLVAPGVAGQIVDAALGQKHGAGASGPAQAGALNESIAHLAERVKQVEPIGRPLTPASPCVPPDMLGAPGRAC